MHENMELVFLGTGASWPSVERNVPAVALKRGSEIVLFDCGEGTQRQFQRSTVSYMQVRHIFVTHLHMDHFLGLPGLVQTMKLNERREPLSIYGPPGMRQWAERLGLVEPEERKPASRGRGAGRAGGMRVEVHEIQSGAVVQLEGYRVEAKEVRHTAYALAYALVEDPRPGRFNKPRALELGVPEGKMFGQLQRGEAVTLDDGRIVTPEMVLGPTRRGRKVVYTGDCVPCEQTVELAQGADVLVHESTYANDFPDANKHGHSTAAQAAFIAKAARVSTLYLTHISPRYTSAKPLVEEARKIFPESHEAHDLLSVVVRFPPDEAAAADAPA
ncbi:MAG TPA: ribonuclease Z [Candidatus Thermoplasmatota archaeon]|nr:ribonuclease Z [Candidatus Thermoplasmatota archaeon]